MRSTARLLTIFAVIFTAISFLGAVMLTVALQSVLLSFGMKLSIILYLYATSFVALLLTISLRSLCRDLDLEYETTATKLRDLTKKVHALEEKCK